MRRPAFVVTFIEEDGRAGTPFRCSSISLDKDQLTVSGWPMKGIVGWTRRRDGSFDVPASTNIIGISVTRDQKEVA